MFEPLSVTGLFLMALSLRSLITNVIHMSLYFNIKDRNSSFTLEEKIPQNGQPKNCFDGLPLPSQEALIWNQVWMFAKITWFISKVDEQFFPNSISKQILCPGQVVQLVGVSTHTPKDWEFDSQSGYIPRLRLQFWLRHIREATNQFFPHTDYLSLSLSPSFLFLSKITRHILG